MAVGRTNALSQGGLPIDGLIASYTALGGITAGDFVALTKAYRAPSSAKASGTSPFLQYFSATGLDETTVFLAHADGELDALFGAVISVAGGAVSVVSRVQLTSGSSSGLYPQVQALANGNLFIAYGSSSANPTAYSVCSVSGSQISVLASGTLVSTAKTANNSVLCKMKDGSLAFIYLAGAYYYGIKITENGSGVTISSPTQIIGSLTCSAFTARPSACCMDDGSLLVMHGTTDTDNAFFIVSPAFALLYEKVVNPGSYTARKTSLLRLGENKFFAIRVGGMSYSALEIYGRVVYAAGSTLAFGAETKLLAGYELGEQIGSCLLPNGQVLLCCVSGAYGANAAATASIIDISGEDTYLASQYNLAADGAENECAGCIALPGGETLLLFSEYDYFYLYGAVLPYDTLAKSGKTADAIALESAENGGTLKIFIPKGEQI